MVATEEEEEDYAEAEAEAREDLGGTRGLSIYSYIHYALRVNFTLLGHVNFTPPYFI